MKTKLIKLKYLVNFCLGVNFVCFDLKNKKKMWMCVCVGFQIKDKNLHKSHIFMRI